MKNYVEVPDPCDLTELLDGYIESEEEDKDLVMEVNDSDESDEES